MDLQEFEKHGKNMIDFICDYRKNIESYEVSTYRDAPDKLKIEYGYLKKLIPNHAPDKGENFDIIMADFMGKILPGMLHWNHPNFFAYFPAGDSFPSILGELLIAAMGVIGFSWASCPANSELENIVMNWYGRAINLPEQFLSDVPNSIGGGCLAGSASECILLAMMAARFRAIKVLRGEDTQNHASYYLPRLVAYTSSEAHSCVEKAALMSIVNLRLIPANPKGEFCYETLRKTIAEDKKNNLVPFYVVATVGTTGICAFDNLEEVGKICKEEPLIWYHVDGAYAGSSFMLPEMKKYSKGLEYADSFNTNPNKFLLTHFDASAMWVKSITELTAALTVNPIYLDHPEKDAIDYRHYGIPLSRRFRSLKLWFVFRTYGLDGLKSYIRRHIQLAKYFENLVNNDKRFAVKNEVVLGLVCFKLVGSNELNITLLGQLNRTGKIHMIPTKINNEFVIRFCIVYEHATKEHINRAWKLITEVAADVLEISEKASRNEPIPLEKKFTRSMSLRFSFTRSVSRDLYENQPRGLTDGGTPVVVYDNLDDDFDNATNGHNDANNNENALASLNSDGLDEQNTKK